MNENELMHKVSVYANNTAHIIADSRADPKSKKLAQDIVGETCDVLAAIIGELCRQSDFDL